MIGFREVAVCYFITSLSVWNAFHAILTVPDWDALKAIYHMEHFIDKEKY